GFCTCVSVVSTRRERVMFVFFFFFQAEDGIRDDLVTGVQTCALPIWANGFRAKQGHVRLKAYLINTSQAFASLLTGQADIGLMGHRTWHTSLMGFHQAFGYDPLEIRFATGSYDDPEGSTPGLMFIVHKSNPLRGVTLQQIDGIFGAQRTGGWNGTKWSTAAARGPEGNIRTWGQLGLTGEWADKPIHVHGSD